MDDIRLYADQYRIYSNQAQKDLSNGHLKAAKSNFVKAKLACLQVLKRDPNARNFNQLVEMLDGVINKIDRDLLSATHKENKTMSEDEYECKELQDEGVIDEDNNVEVVSLDDALKELNSLVGLDRVKQEVSDLVDQAKVFRARESTGLKNPDITYHLVFAGNPGTGKTTVARIIGKIYRNFNFVII